MPRTDHNLRVWTETDWDDAERAWSEVWGHPSTIFWCTLFPRISTLLPTGTILEIGPGNGRFSRFLERLCRRLVLVDLTPRCIELCRSRFADRQHIEYHVNDGYTLADVAPRSVNFAFSFDSLPHATLDVVTSYVRELERTLVPGGHALIHHSNLARFHDDDPGALPFENPHWRDYGVSADRVLAAIEAAGLVPLVQEEINWGGSALTDCLTLFAARGDASFPPFRRYENPDFMAEAIALEKLFRHWNPGGPDYIPVVRPNSSGG